MIYSSPTAPERQKRWKNKSEPNFAPVWVRRERNCGSDFFGDCFCFSRFFCSALPAQWLHSGLSQWQVILVMQGQFRCDLELFCSVVPVQWLRSGLSQWQVILVMQGQFRCDLEHAELKTCQDVWSARGSQV